MKDFDRRSGIGGSEVASILGENPFESPLDVYLRKLGLVEERQLNENMRWGTVLEEPIAQEYARRNQVQLANPDTVIDKKKPFFFVSPDRFILPFKQFDVIPVKNVTDKIWKIEDIQKGLEIKTAGIHTASKFGEAGTDDVPPAYLIQMMWAISITAIPVWDLAVLIAGQEYREYQIKKNSELIGGLREAAEKFWVDNVMKKTPPLPEGTAREREAISRLYPDNIGEFRDATDEDLEWINLLRDARDEMDKLQVSKLTAENNIKLSIGDHDGLIIPEVFGGGKITWKKTKGRVKVDYKGLADQFDPSEELIQRFTNITDGHKMFLVPRKWKDNK